ncbi:MAG: wecB [Thermoleophilia bacterium]|nr:wecB [Thermoleophilia bacterium]
MLAGVSEPSIVVVLGNRPQFIKHAALARVWAERAEGVRQIVVDTGQHYDHALAGIFMDELKMPTPDFSLGVGSGTHAEQLARMLEPLEEILVREKPASIVLYGDTNSTLGGALVASKLHVPIAHIEAGLRSYDMLMPEEVNRVMCDHVSNMLFAPTDAAVANLEREGITGERVHRTGDVMADIAMAVAPAADARLDPIAATLRARGIDLPDAGHFGIVTIHRASNTEPDALREVIDCLTAAAEHLPLVFPVHPRTEAAATNAGLHLDLAEIPGLIMLPPLGYLDMTALVRAARVAITDSGGLQKEAFVHGTPCITMRDRTEWVETVESGWNACVGTDAQELVRVLELHHAAFGDEPWYQERPDLYGNGTAAEQILDVLVRHASFSPF